MARKSGEDNDARMQNMIQYIEQDGHEKAEEIDVLAEEEYNIEKKQYLGSRIEAVKKYYDNLESKYQQQIVLDISKIKNQAYRDILTSRNTVVEDVFEAVKERLGQLTNENNISIYRKVLYELTIQGLAKILEPNIVLQVRKTDVEIAKKVIKQAQDQFLQSTGMAVNLSVNEKSFLPENCGGGIVMYNKSGRVSLNNTLVTKLELVRHSIMPHVRKALFGVNPNRVHLE